MAFIRVLNEKGRSVKQFNLTKLGEKQAKALAHKLADATQRSHFVQIFREAKSNKRGKRAAEARKDLIFKWSFGNEKLGKNPVKTVGFTLPALRSDEGFNTCPRAGVCAGYCFGLQGRMLMPMAHKAYERNLEIVRKLLDTEGANGLASALLHDLEMMPKIKLIRVNVLGDFFSQEYLDAWIATATALPDRTFYCYTKMHAQLDFSALPDNFMVTQSVGGQDDDKIDYSKPHSRVFVSHADRKRAGYLDATGSDMRAVRGDIKQGLVYHGVKNLTPVQQKHLRVLEAMMYHKSACRGARVIE